jgi:Asp-tRNA(Asn)/Glu-tRNA(Gln) amidotransferase A subunit family amidase
LLCTKNATITVFRTSPHLMVRAMKPDTIVAPGNHLSASRAAAMISARQLSSLQLVESCLGRIALREPMLHAWSHLDEEGARRQARARDESTSSGPLHGVPVAIKDVIDVSGMPTGMGSPIYEDYRPIADAACVAALRAAGAIILGKTVTAEFAGVFPGPTTHPLAPGCTPGGSSSGSAAAVADRMVPVALGTQTGGSIVRPAAFCGIVGFKPSFGTINRAGLKLAAEGLDTIGLMARDVDDIELVWNVLVNRAPTSPASLDVPPRLLLFRSHHWSRASADTVAAVENTARRLQSKGAVIDELPVPNDFAELSNARVIINGYERARALAWEFNRYADRFSPAMSRVLTDGWSFPYESYLGAIRTAERWRSWFADATGDHDAVLTAAVNGEAPQGLDSTGDASFQEIWTILHAPSITFPVATGRTGLPIGVQLVGRHLADAALLRLANWAIRGSAAASTPIVLGQE